MLSTIHTSHIKRCVLPFVAGLALAAAFVVALHPVRSAHAQSAKRSDIWHFVEDNCLSCHFGELKSGDVTFDATQFATETASAELLQRVFQKVATGEMPPEDAAAQPPPADLERFVNDLAQLLTTVCESAGTPRLRAARLTNEEYANTIADLLGVNFVPDDPGSLIADESLHGFRRQRDIQPISIAHIERYVMAAESIVEEAYPKKSPANWHWSADAVDLLAGTELPAKDAMQIARNAGTRIDLWPGQLVRTVELEIASPGDYQFQLKTSCVAGEDHRSPWLTITAESLGRTVYAGPCLATESSPRDLQFTAHLPAGRHVFSIANQVYGPPILPAMRKSLSRPFLSFAQGYLPWQVVLLSDDKSPLFPCVLVDTIQIEGPIVSPVQQERRDRFLTQHTTSVEHAMSGLTRFIELAFRRTPSEHEIDNYRQLLQSQIAQGEGVLDATKTAMVAVLASREFLYLKDGPLHASESRTLQWELASRLSYLLWNTMPDQELLDIARDGRLADDDVLRPQFHRLLNDPRAERFAASFASQWLQLDRIGMFPPDKSLFPNYDGHLEASFKREPTEYFREMLESNLPLREFLSSDWAMLDARLASHYGISGVTSHNSQRVQLDPDASRGGILTQAGILSLTSDGARQRPVHRGVWVWETILGRSIPAPPANVEPIPTADAGQAKATIRARLESHQQQPACASCHRKIDPLGFAFENYDALGRWRTVEKVRGGSGDDPPVDASGQLTDGRTFADADEFKQLLVDDADQFVQAFIRKLATYGLRRQLSPGDETEIARIVQETHGGDDRLRDVLEVFVMSDLFRGRISSAEQSGAVQIR